MSQVEDQQRNGDQGTDLGRLVPAIDVGGGDDRRGQDQAVDGSGNVPRVAGPGQQLRLPALVGMLEGAQILWRSSSFLPITMRWISEVPSPISSSGASR